MERTAHPTICRVAETKGNIMRKTNSEGGIIVRAYDIYPQSIPDRWWRLAKEMQAAWNTLAMKFDETWKKSCEIENKADRKMLWVNFQDSVYLFLFGDGTLEGESDTAKRRRSAENWDRNIKVFISSGEEADFNTLDLPSDCRGLLFDRFKVTCDTFFKGLKKPPNERPGPPKVQFGIKKINFPFFDRTGGRDIAWLYRKSSRVQIKPVPESYFLNNSRDSRRLRFTKGCFGIAGESVPFQFVMHRPFPSDVVLKRVNFTGKYDSCLKKWNWQIIFTFQSCQAITPNLPQTWRSFGLDIGYRHFHKDGYTRIGVGADESGNIYELRFPDDFSSRHEILNRKWSKERNHQGLHLAEYSIRAIAEIQQQLDLHLETVKAEVAKRMNQWPPSMESSRDDFRKMRGKGLKRLYHACRQSPETSSDLACVLEKWIETDDIVRKQIRIRQIHIDRKLDWLYGNIAAWMTTNFDSIRWEGDLNLKKIAEEENDDLALKLGQKYRQAVSWFRGRAMIKQSVKKTGRELIDRKSSGTSRVCWKCGGKIETGPKLEVTCENGHVHDTDENSARIIHGSCDGNNFPVMIPQWMKPYIVVLSRAKSASGTDFARR